MELYIPDDMIWQFRKDATNEMNRTVMEWYGISFSTLQRFKRELGVEKDMAKVRHKQAQLTKRICEKNGYYDSLRGKRPTEQCYDAARKLRETGFVPLLQLKKTNPRKFKRLMKQKSEARKALIDTERRRYNISLMPLSNLPTIIYAGCRYSRKDTTRRSCAKQRGYVPGSADPDIGERYIIYYNDKTKRNAEFERNCIKAGFEIRSITSRGKLLSVQENENALLSE